MNAVGIDVSKGKSMVAALRPMGEVALLPQEFLHTGVGLEQMAYAILALGEDTRVVMEATGRYHEPVAAALHEYGIYVCVLNPLYIKQSGGGSIRKVKTDKADAMKIAKYGLDNWVDLREYTPMDTVRQQLKLCSRQYNLYMKTVVSLQNNLISLTDKTFPGVNELFSSPERASAASARRHSPSATRNGASVRVTISVKRKLWISTPKAAAISPRYRRTTTPSCSLPQPHSSFLQERLRWLLCEQR